MERGLGRAGAEERAVACDRYSITASVCHRVEDVGAGVKSAARRSSRIEARLTVSVTEKKRELNRAVTIFVLSVVEMVPASSTVPFQTDFLLLLRPIEKQRYVIIMSNMPSSNRPSS